MHFCLVRFCGLFWQPRFREHGLSLEVPIKFNYMDSLGAAMPCLQPNDFFQQLANVGWLGVVLGGLSPMEAKPMLHTFWKRYKEMYPSHQIFTEGRHINLEQCIPIYGHIDEGRGHKKSGVALCNSHGAIGKGTRPFCKKHVVSQHLKKQKMGLNMIGKSQATRLLHFAMAKKQYAKNPQVYNEMFEKVVSGWKSLQVDGFEVSVGGAIEKWFAVVLGLKADLPALAQTGDLKRPLTLISLRCILCCVALIVVTSTTTTTTTTTYLGKAAAS